MQSKSSHKPNTTSCLVLPCLALSWVWYFPPPLFLPSFYPFLPYVFLETVSRILRSSLEFTRYQGWLWTTDLPLLHPECWGYRHLPLCMAPPGVTLSISNQKYLSRNLWEELSYVGRISSQVSCHHWGNSRLSIQGKGSQCEWKKFVSSLFSSSSILWLLWVKENHSASKHGILSFPNILTTRGKTPLVPQAFRGRLPSSSVSGF